MEALSEDELLEMAEALAGDDEEAEGSTSAVRQDEEDDDEEQRVLAAVDGDVSSFLAAANRELAEFQELLGADRGGGSGGDLEAAADEAMNDQEVWVVMGQGVIKRFKVQLLGSNPLFCPHPVKNKEEAKVVSLRR